ncbi:cupin domain-containing protein [Marinicella meishanensis]|uniref:cupin domain-containing protein n=1 Tax=Marinicella meishanensis TaxID=2873263 RepID=UPI001CC09607|nr:cupin domain-containing protein [Marinicella sp. NBU2979]
MPQNKPNVFDGQAITASDFLLKHWQQAPYLFTNTGIDLSCLPSQADLFELAAEPDVQSRIVYTEDGRHYQAIYDDPEAWDEVADCQPTLLVSDIEKWHPPAGHILQWFPFIKNWRFDDLMMSYAPTGASVGAHTDHYDVFLLQVQGTRQWAYDHQPLRDLKLVADSELAVIDGYQPQVSHELQPGDVLYLPPEIPHHGIATSDDCLTCSIGLRAPSAAEVLQAAVEQHSAQLPASQRFRDAVTQLANDADIGAHEIQYLRKQLQQLAAADDQALASWFGQLVTGYRLLDEAPWAAQPPHTNQTAWQKSPFSVFAYHQSSQHPAQLFVNGEVFHCRLELAQAICNQTQFSLESLQHLDPDRVATQRLLKQLIDSQALIPAA